MMQKGRGASGMRLPQTKLTAEQVLEIRQSYKGNVKYNDGPSLKELAEKHGVGVVAIHNVLKHKSHKGGTDA